MIQLLVGLLGLIISQLLTFLSESKYLLITKVFEYVALVCFGNMLFEIGYEFKLDHSRYCSYFKDYIVSLVISCFQWFIITLYLYNVLPFQAESDPWDHLVSIILVARFCTPTSGGYMFSYLNACGLNESWVYTKANIYANFDDLNDAILLLPVQIIYFRNDINLIWVVVFMFALLYTGLKFKGWLNINNSFRWIIVYTLGIVFLLELIFWAANGDVHERSHYVELVYPCFCLGMYSRNQLIDLQMKQVLDESKVDEENEDEDLSEDSIVDNDIPDDNVHDDDSHSHSHSYSGKHIYNEKEKEKYKYKEKMSDNPYDNKNQNQMQSGSTEDQRSQHNLDKIKDKDVKDYDVCERDNLNTKSQKSIESKSTLTKLKRQSQEDGSYQFNPNLIYKRGSNSNLPIKGPQSNKRQSILKNINYTKVEEIKDLVCKIEVREYEVDSDLSMENYDYDELLQMANSILLFFCVSIIVPNVLKDYTIDDAAEHYSAELTISPSYYLLHVVVVSILANAGRLILLMLDRHESTHSERMSLILGLCPKGEMSLGMILYSIRYGARGPVVMIAILSILLLLLFNGFILAFVKYYLQNAYGEHINDIHVHEEQEYVTSYTRKSRAMSRLEKNIHLGKLNHNIQNQSQSQGNKDGKGIGNYNGMEGIDVLKKRCSKISLHVVKLNNNNTNVKRNTRMVPKQ